MTTTERAAVTTGVVYDLQGTLLEACSCLAVCPCWVGQDPDGGSCDAFNAYRFQHGTIRGIDVSGLSFINVVHIPGNVLAPGSWQVVSSPTTGPATSSSRPSWTPTTGGSAGPWPTWPGWWGRSSR
jgi:hypothetical protein